MANLDLNFEQITPWNGANDTGRDVRLKWQRNFDRVAAALQVIVTDYANFLRKDKVDATNYLLKLLGGAEVGEAIDSIVSGKGTILDANGRIQAERMELRSSLTVMEIIFNRLSAMESNYAFSESAKIESIEEQTDNDGNTYYRLTFEKRWDSDFHAFQQDDILYGQINDLASGGREYTTSWMRCLEYTDAAANQVDVVLYADNLVPGGKNYTPDEMMKVIRRGNATNTDRQSYWYLSALDEKCFVWLEGVDAPILQEANYYMILGKLKELTIFDNLPINYNHSYMYARGAIIQDLFRVDFQGVAHKSERVRGIWDIAIATSDEPYESTDTSFDSVWHNGCKWQCLVLGTTDEPAYASDGWSMIEGNPEFTIDIESSEGWYFDSDDVMIKDSAGIYLPFTILSVKGKLYHGDVTDYIDDSNVSWTRDTGNASDDASWAMAHSGIGKTLELTRDDLGSQFPNVNNVKFTATAFIDDGVVNVIDSMSVVF